MKTKTPVVGLRWFAKHDLEPAVALEKEIHTTEDPDFQIPVLPAYVWQESDFTESIRQYRSQSKSTNDTRAWVAEEHIGKQQKMAGTLIYEMGAEHYEILLFSAKGDHVRKGMLDHLLEKLNRSDTRTKLKISVADGDYKNLKFLMDNGFRVKLVPKPGVGEDEWYCERHKEKQSNE